MPSGAGEIYVRRRRGVINLFNLSVIYRSFALFYYFTSKFYPPKNPNKNFQEAFCSKSYSTDGRVICYSTSSDLNQVSDAYPLMNPTSEASNQSNCSLSHISEQDFINTSFGSRSGLASRPPFFPSYWISLMAKVSFRPSDVPFPVGTSTAHGELISWQMVQQDAPSPHVTPIFQNGGESCSHHQTASILGFTRMGLGYIHGPLTPMWTISRSDFSTALLSIPQKSVCLIMERKVSHSVIGTLSLGKTSVINPPNRMDIAFYLPPDVSLSLKLCGASNIMYYDTYQTAVPFPDLEPSLKLPSFDADKVISSSLSLVPTTSAWSSQDFLGSRALASLEWFDRLLCRGHLISLGRMFALGSNKYEPEPTLFLNPLLFPIEPTSHLSPLDLKLGYVVNFQGQTDFKLCVDFLNLHDSEFHVREDPPALIQFVTHALQIPFVASYRTMRSVSKSLKYYVTMLMNPLLWARSSPTVPLVKHFSTSSNALSARAFSDLSWVEDLVKPCFQDESALVPTDFSNIEKLVQVENPFVKLMELLSLCCFVYVKSGCKNSPLFEVSA